MMTTPDLRHIYTADDGTEWLVDPRLGSDTRLKDLDPDVADQLRQEFGAPKRVAISETLKDFFESEVSNTRQAIAQGDLDPDHPLTLSTALDSLRQAPDDAQLIWMTETGFDNVVGEADMAERWEEAFGTLLELANLFDLYGGDTSLTDWL